MKRLTTQEVDKIIGKEPPTPAWLLRRLADVLDEKYRDPQNRDFNEYCRVARVLPDLRGAATKMDLNYEYGKRRKKRGGRRA